jgi:hypothetical protein
MGVAAVTGASAAPLGVVLGVQKLDAAGRDTARAISDALRGGAHHAGDGLAAAIAAAETAAKRAAGAVRLPSSATAVAEGVFAITAIGGTVYLVYTGYRFLRS